ncbi:MAG TPA: ABC transporter ATP-binding protein [Candidatus Krumholzibacteriaceae bacterium]|nr:ABC transporter ATP-binding protein [Candidatus Krumholzibacteriaceae bacterium]
MTDNSKNTESRPVIRIVNISKTFEGQRVLTGLDLDVLRGETVVVIGRSGCGKSVLLRNIAGLMKPDSGEIYFENEDITKFNTRKLFKMRMHFGMLFQGSALFDSMTVGENVALALVKHTGLDIDRINRIVTEKLDLVGLADVTEKYPSELSGGMKKRVALARAVVMDPEVVLYDEPTTGLDPVMSGVINRLIVNLQKELEITSIIVTHDIKSAYIVGDRIAMLHDGKIVYEGTPRQVENSDNPLVKGFVEGNLQIGT